MVIIGDKEQNQGLISIRDRAGNDLGTQSFDDFEKLLIKESN